MKHKFILTEYIKQAMSSAEYERLEDGSWCGRIPCLNVITFEASEALCREELQATLEDWILVGLRKGFHIPPVGEIDLCAETAHEPVESL